MNTPGIFYPVIAEEFGVQTAAISAFMSISLLSAAFFQPLMGNLVSRFRVRTMMMAGALVMAFGFMVFSVATAPWMFWAVATLAGMTFAACLSVGPATLINRWFYKHVGLLLGVSAGSSGIGGVIFMFLGQAIIETMGWRTAYVVYAVCIVVVCVPAILLCIKERPEDCGLRPFGMKADEELREEETQARKTYDPEMMKRAWVRMKTPAFALILLAGFLMNVVCQVNGFLPKFVYWVDSQVALGLMSTAAVSGVMLSSLSQAGSAVGKIGLGAFSDISVPQALLLLCSSGAGGLALVWLCYSTPLIVVGAFVYGFFLASVLVLAPMLVRAVFGGGELYPILYSRVAMAPALGGAVANVAWPFIADNLGGFNVVFGLAIFFAIVIFVAGMVALRLPRKSFD